MDDKQYIDGLVKNAKTALKALEPFDQKTIDKMVREIAKYVFDNAADLAEKAQKETRMGSVEYKTKKNAGKARIIWYSLKDKPSMGVIKTDLENGIIEIAKPLGVIGAVQPCTNPIVTPMANVMAAIKTKNTIIVAPHPRAVKTTIEMVNAWNKLLEKYNAPPNIIQCVEDVSIERTNALMKAVTVVVATGGPGMVKAAYSSGAPSFGVGQGNVQCIIDRGVDLRKAVRTLIDGRIFDNGIICAGEQTIITPVELYDEMVTELEAYGGYYVSDPVERKKLLDVLFIDGHLNKDLVGQTVEAIGRMAGIDFPKGTKVIALPEEADNKHSVLRKEKMFPVITPFKYGDFSEAVALALENLEIEGKGHTVCIHSNNQENILTLGKAAPVSRVVVNQPSATTAGGAFSNGLNPTSTLGCGSWGNNSISENFYYKHLLNITRVAMVKEHFTVPTDEELWAEID